MAVNNSIRVINIPRLLTGIIILLILNCLACQNSQQSVVGDRIRERPSDSTIENSAHDEFKSAIAMLVLPARPAPGGTFRIVATGGETILNAEIIISGPSGRMKSISSKEGEELPCWRIDDFTGAPAGKYEARLIEGKKVIGEIGFEIAPFEVTPTAGVVWKTKQGWDSPMEDLYAAWVNALFYGYEEDISWTALHEVTQNKEHNFLYNYLSLGEDDPEGRYRVFMQPDCADNPFFLRAYFAWKLGLPFGYHLCNRGSLFKSPVPGQWITNETLSSKTNPAEAFNNFLRKVADGVHSGTARTALNDEKSDYYPVSLESGSLRPGTVFADPYGHTLVLTGRVPQKNNQPGILLSVDAQPDGTVGIKRFWKGNFLFNTSDVIGEPGFKAFRPISFINGRQVPIQNKELSSANGFVSFSLQQKKMKSDVFYHTMDRLINPKPLDPEAALLDLIAALHEQLKVRVTSVSNGEAYFKSHPGAVIQMPSSAAGIFLAGGQWENFSTPNRDLRLLIAMDAIQDFPEKVAGSPEDYNISALKSAEQVKRMLQSVLDEKSSELTISYTRSDGSVQILTIGEILKRKDAFEMAYNPNDGIEIRWGAPENSAERATCHRHASAGQIDIMRSVRVWFHKRLHPPT